MLKKIKTAVIGVGYLGRLHAQKYANLKNSQLIAVVDSNQATAQSIAKLYGVDAKTDYRELLGQVDAVSIAVPTRIHFQIARDFLNHGSHVLIEKPITVTLAEADALICLAKERKLLIQVGFLERFNAAMLKLNQVLTEPVFIESHRLAIFNSRATDVNVVLDLMIHDIDIILNIVKSELISIKANGVPVLTSSADIANTRLEFANGCVANVTASRVSTENERKMRIFQSNSCITIDFQNHALTVYQKDQKVDEQSIPRIVHSEHKFEENDALKIEIIAFLRSIETKSTALVTGEDGRKALEIAIKISQFFVKH